MAINRSELKQNAKDSLRGKWGIAIGIVVVYLIITESIPLMQLVDNENLTLFIGIASILYFAYIFIIPALNIGFRKAFLNISRNQVAGISDLFDGFSVFWKSFGLYFMMGSFTLLWSLLLIIPGIIASLRYSMAPYIMADNHDIGIMDAIKESKRITYGHKWDIFVLSLSFIGWGLLCGLTLGIGLLWLSPYMATTYANLYKKLSAKPEPETDGVVESANLEQTI